MIYAMINAGETANYLKDNLALTIVLGAILVLIAAVFVAMIVTGVKARKKARAEKVNTAEEPAAPLQETQAEPIAETAEAEPSAKIGRAHV